MTRIVKEMTPAWAALPQRDWGALAGIIVHRIEVSQEDAAFPDTAAGIERFFREHPTGVQATGGKMPYPLVLDAQGLITQTVPLGRVTPHARRYNASTLAVACIGDFRKAPPSAVQRAALVRLCAELVRACQLSPAKLWGHDELDGASADPNKECPGRLLPLAPLRGDVEAATLPAVPLGLEW